MKYKCHVNIFLKGKKDYLDIVQGRPELYEAVVFDKIYFEPLYKNQFMLYIPKENKIKVIANVYTSSNTVSKSSFWHSMLKPTKKEEELFDRYVKAWKLMEQ